MGLIDLLTGIGTFDRPIKIDRRGFLKASIGVCMSGLVGKEREAQAKNGKTYSIREQVLMLRDGKYDPLLAYYNSFTREEDLDRYECCGNILSPDYFSIDNKLRSMHYRKAAVLAMMADEEKVKSEEVVNNLLLETVHNLREGDLKKFMEPPMGGQYVSVILEAEHDIAKYILTNRIAQLCTNPDDPILCSALDGRPTPSGQKYQNLPQKVREYFEQEILEGVDIHNPSSRFSGFCQEGELPKINYGGIVNNNAFNIPNHLPHLLRMILPQRVIPETFGGVFMEFNEPYFVCKLASRRAKLNYCEKQFEKLNVTP